MNEYPNKFALEKSMNIFANEYIYVQNILMYSNIRSFGQDCFGLFLPFLYFVLFWIHIESFGTKNINFYPFFKNQNTQIHPLS